MTDLPFDAPGGLLAEQRPGDNAEPMSVTELSGALKRTVEDRFGHVRLRGEISGWKRAASGHAYLCLKDDAAVIDGVIWKGQAAALQFTPQDGVEVIATGRVTTYPGRSKYQIVIERMELAGEGALMALFEKLKAQLAGEGLFAASRKQPLPFMPRTIGVVTSPTGAVIRDILHRLADRCPAHVLVWPVKVQGAGRGGGGRRGDPRVRRDRARRAGTAPRPADRRARRRLDRGSLGVQRGSRGARHRRLLASPSSPRSGMRPIRRCPISPPICARRPRPRRPRSRCRCAPSCDRC